MSLFTLLSTAVAVPLSVVLLIFTWFMIKAQFTTLRLNKGQPAKDKKTTIKIQSTPPLSTVQLSSSFVQQSEPFSVMTGSFETSSSDSTVSYQPLSTYLGEGGEDISFRNASSDVAMLIPEISSLQFDIKDIPGINGAIEKELFELGYSSVEQIARWGRADVRAVSSTLGIDQQKIEDEWIAGARLILSIR